MCIASVVNAIKIVLVFICVICKYIIAFSFKLLPIIYCYYITSYCDNKYKILTKLSFLYM